MRHPAKYSDILLPKLAYWLQGYERIFDPFAGTGKIKNIRPDAVLVELEPEWAEMNGAIVGDATCLPFGNKTFDACVCSPCYGNRMSDHFTDHQVEKRYRRNTYTHALGRKLSKNNSGAMQWGEEYRQLHTKAWQEVWRVLRPGGRFVLNISNHIRNGLVQPVTEWHYTNLLILGFHCFNLSTVETPRLRYGQNSDKRVAFEYIIVFQKPK